jgi:peptidoglycan/LPS O-acetylase OafA/YrhL
VRQAATTDVPPEVPVARVPSGTPPPRPPNAAAGHLPALDGVRGIAVLMVLLLHATFYGGSPPGPEAPLVDRAYYEVMLTGWTGVDLFFVLSGFLITGILLDTRGSPSFFRSFYARRLLRIVPLYTATLLVFCVALPAALPNHAGFQALRADAPWYWAYLANVLVAWRGWPDFAPLSHLWSLAVEEQFYLVWPVVVLACGRRRLLAVCGACAVVAATARVGLHVLGAPGVASYVLTVTRMDTLAAGAALAALVRRPGGVRVLARAARPAAILAAGLLAALAVRLRGLPAEHRVTALVGYPLVAVLCAALVGLAITADRDGITGRLLTCRALTRLGQYSYAAYVVHHPLLLLRPAWLSADALPSVLGSRIPAQIAMAALTVGASFLLALASWQLIERRFLGLKVRFPYLPAAPKPRARGGG